MSGRPRRGRRATAGHDHTGQPSHRALAPGGVRLSVVVPAYREAATIGATVERLRAELGDLDGGLEVVVVDDGSPDDTADAARRAAADLVVEQRPNRGKGAAVRAGVLAATGRTVAFTDADLSYSPDQVRRLLHEVEAGWDVVVGSRRHPDAVADRPAPLLRRLGGRAVNQLTRVVLRHRHADTQCGLKAFRSDVARVVFGQTRLDGFAFDVELFVLAERLDLSLLEVPARVADEPGSTVRVARDAARLAADVARLWWWGRRGHPDPSAAAGLPPRGSGVDH